MNNNNIDDDNDDEEELDEGLVKEKRKKRFNNKRKFKNRKPVIGPPELKFKDERPRRKNWLDDFYDELEEEEEESYIDEI